MPPLAIRQELHRIQEPRLLLDFIQDHQAGAVVEPTDGVGGKAQAFVRVVEGEIYEWELVVFPVWRAPVMTVIGQRANRAWRRGSSRRG